MPTGSRCCIGTALTGKSFTTNQTSKYEEEFMSQVLSERNAGTQSAVPVTTVHRVEADGVQVFYRAAGDPAAPVVLLLHGVPTSSFMFRELIPRLADQFRVIAPDLPGFGFTEVPESRKYKYSFENLAGTIDAFA